MIDLHTHSNCSDGALTPLELLSRAQAAGVELFAITDHDTLSAFDTLAPGKRGDLHLVSGIELSSRWRRQGVHLVGLNVDIHSAAMAEAVGEQCHLRLTRFRRILEKLQKAGLQLDDKAILDESGASPGRPHIARYLASSGQVKNEQDAFKRFLGKGKTGDVHQDWPDMPRCIDWIRGAGGSAVLAHPLKYGLTRTKMHELASDFAAAGGQAVEVMSGMQTADQCRAVNQLARNHGLMASVGSDFHDPDFPGSRLGCAALSDADLVPVWSQF